MMIRKLKKEDCQIISDAFKEQGWDKPVEQYQTYFQEQNEMLRDVLVAEYKDEFAGYLTIVWNSQYPPFKKRQIPEVVDFSVLKKFHRQGIGSKLMDDAEKMISIKSDLAGIGVGLFSDYGNAQRLYVKRGYIPDGLGISQKGRFPKFGETITVDDDLALYFTKQLK